MKTIIKFTLAIMFAIFASKACANEIKNYIGVNIYNNVITADSVSNIVVDVPSTVKLFKSENDKIYMRIRTLKGWLLNELSYNIENDKIIIKPKHCIDSFEDSDNVIIYLFAPDNVNLTTSNSNLLVRNTIKANNETKK